MGGIIFLTIVCWNIDPWSAPHIEIRQLSCTTNQWIYTANQWTDFYMRATPALNGLRLNGGLNHIIFLFLFLVLFATVDVFSCIWNLTLSLNPLLVNALLHKSLDLLNVVPFAEKVLILLDISSWRFLIIFGGWLERMLIYNGSLSGLL